MNKSKQLKSLLSASVTVALLSGCVTTTKSKDVPENLYSMNQPAVDDLVVLSTEYKTGPSKVDIDALSDIEPVDLNESTLDKKEDEPHFKITSAPPQTQKKQKNSATFQSNTGITNTKYTSESGRPTQATAYNSNSASKTIVKSSETRILPIEAPPARSIEVAEPIQENNIITSVEEVDVHTYVMIKGETYKAALYRWLNDENYKKIGELLDEEHSWRLSQKIDQDHVITSTFDKAIDHIVEQLSHKAMPKETGILDAGFEPLENTPPEENFTLRIEVDKQDKTAIITSSILPVTMFEVQKGDLLTNYLRIAHHYKWEADEEFYLTSNYPVPFNYLVVTEAGNFRSALQKFLKPYPKVKASLYHPKRQIFIVGDKA